MNKTQYTAKVSDELDNRLMECRKFLVETGSLPGDDKNPDYVSKYRLTNFALELLANSLDKKMRSEIINKSKEGEDNGE